jgi:predicted RNase H-like nuclease (RuvC/YqgF family)
MSLTRPQVDRTQQLSDRPETGAPFASRTEATIFSPPCELVVVETNSTTATRFETCAQTQHERDHRLACELKQKQIQTNQPSKTI